MAVFATQSQRLSNLIKKTDSNTPEFYNEVVTVNEASAATYKVGTVLGLVTATGKYKVSVQTAVDGSQNPVAVVIGDTTGYPRDFSVAATTDTKILAMVRGKAILSAGALFLDASFSDATKIAAAYASLKTVNLFVEQTN